MEMKIQSEALGGTNAAETARTNASTPDRHRLGNSEIGAAGHGPDSVAVSSFASRIAEASRADESRIATRVSQLAAQYARGEYRPDAASLSRAMISRALADVKSGGKL